MGNSPACPGRPHGDRTDGGCGEAASPQSKILRGHDAPCTDNPDLLADHSIVVPVGHVGVRRVPAVDGSNIVRQRPYLGDRLRRGVQHGHPRVA